MRVGLMVGTDKERPRADRLAGLVADVQAAEADGFASLWFPQVPGYLDALTVMTVLGCATSRIELGTAVVPVQTRHPVPMAQQALTTQLACGGRFTLGLGASHHWIVSDQFGLPYEKPALLVRDYLEVLNAAIGAAGSGADGLTVENDSFRVHSPMNVADPIEMPVLLAALAPLMLRTAGAAASGTILWMADEKAVSDHVVPIITKAAAEAGRPAPRIVAGIPVTLCRPDEVAAARTYAGEVLGHAEVSPNYLKLLEHGDARDVGDTMAAGDEEAILARMRSYRDAGVTELSARIVGLGDDPAAQQASRARTQQALAGLMGEL